MGTAFIILAAGRGTRVGRVGGGLHKALLPLQERAMLSHLVALAPEDSTILVCVGDRATQIASYCDLARLDTQCRRLKLVPISGWDSPGSGPGASLLQALQHVPDGDDVMFTSCDTLWHWGDDTFRVNHGTWVGVAPVPAGTPPARWCRVVTNTETGYVTNIIDKDPHSVDGALAYIGLARIRAADTPAFKIGLTSADEVAGERQVSGGLKSLMLSRPHAIDAQRLDWIDVGDEDAYRRAVATVTGYDWIKTGQATYVLPETGRVVKYNENDTTIIHRYTRGLRLGDAAPTGLERAANMLAYDYVPGISGYEAVDRGGGTHTTSVILDWFGRHIWPAQVASTTVTKDDLRAIAMSFYRDKTFERIAMLPPHLRSPALDVATHVSWSDLVRDVRPGVWHGDLNFGNIVMEDTGPAAYLGGANDPRITGIDWREDFGGVIEWGDLRYDLAKLLAGCVVHWDNARRGDFRPWDAGAKHADMIHAWGAQRVDDMAQIEIIAALSLINSSPLHSPPLDEVLVSRGVSWLESVL